ncbi:MAG: hypothetical protein IT374_28435 [Polyangiaceae bacterium]|nr:hypothetical protein [Polyangiaceae bacterium]
MTRREKIVVALLGLGVVLGLGVEAARVRRWHRGCAVVSRDACACAHHARHAPPR